MLMGRLKSLLEGSCEAWCKAAACKQEEPQRTGGSIRLVVLYPEFRLGWLEATRHLNIFGGAVPVQVLLPG